MGTWGSGLYSNDMAEDLRPLVSTALKLPLPIEEIVDLIVASEQQVALDSDDEDYTAFWLVFADLIWKSGDRSERVFAKATGLIEGGDDLKMCESLGMEGSDLRKRAKALDALKLKLTKANEGKSRKTLSKPLPQLFCVGDMLTFPVDERGQPANPYFPVKHLEQTFTATSKKSSVILEAGMAFDFFPWYRPLVQLFKNGEAVDEWVTMNPGTVSRPHMKKMCIEVSENLALSPVWLASTSSTWQPGDSYAVSDISMCNSLGMAESRNAKSYRMSEWQA